MQTLTQILAAHPILSSIYIVCGVFFWSFCMFRLHQYIQYGGLDYSSGLYANMTAAQQRIEYNKYKLKTWFFGIIILTLFAIIWPIAIFFRQKKKK